MLSNSKAPGGGLNALYMLRDAMPYLQYRLCIWLPEIDYRATVLPRYLLRLWIVCLPGYMSRTDFKASRKCQGLVGGTIFKVRAADEYLGNLGIPTGYISALVINQSLSKNNI